MRGPSRDCGTDVWSELRARVTDSNYRIGTLIIAVMKSGASEPGLDAGLPAHYAILRHRLLRSSECRRRRRHGALSAALYHCSSQASAATVLVHSPNVRRSLQEKRTQGLLADPDARASFSDALHRALRVVRRRVSLQVKTERAALSPRPFKEPIFSRNGATWLAPYVAVRCRSGPFANPDCSAGKHSYVMSLNERVPRSEPLLPSCLQEKVSAFERKTRKWAMRRGHDKRVGA